MKLFLLLFFTVYAIGQQSFPLKGQVVTVNQSPENINIINKTQGYGVVTDFDGNFEIEVSFEDHLVIGSMTVFTQNVVVTKELLNDGFLEIELLEKNVELNEVILTKYKSINAVSMGILTKPAKVHTRADRRLSMGGAGSERAYQTLLKEAVRDEVIYLFPPESVKKKLGIPEGFVNSFYFYVSDDPQISTIIKTKNLLDLELKLSELATNYKEEFKTLILEQNK